MNFNLKISILPRMLDKTMLLCCVYSFHQEGVGKVSFITLWSLHSNPLTKLFVVIFKTPVKLLCNEACKPLMNGLQPTLLINIKYGNIYVEYSHNIVMQHNLYNCLDHKSHLKLKFATRLALTGKEYLLVKVLLTVF